MTPIQADPNHQFNSVADSTLEAAQQNTRFAMQSHVNTLNSAKVSDYEAQWKQYVAARDARPDATNLIVPIPALAKNVFVDSLGWPYVDDSSFPVVTPHAYIAPATYGNAFFNAGAALSTVARDIFVGPPLVQVTKADGTVWMRIK